MDSEQVNQGSYARCSHVKLPWNVTKTHQVRVSMLKWMFRVPIWGFWIDPEMPFQLRSKANELWETIVRLETEKYDLEERQKRQDYDVSTVLMIGGILMIISDFWIIKPFICISWKSWEKGRGSRTSRRPLSSAWIQSKKEGRISCLEPHLGGWMAEWIDSRFTLVESWWRRLLRRSHYSQDLQSDGLWTSDLINLTGQIFHSSKSSRKGRNSSSDKRPWRRDWILSKEKKLGWLEPFPFQTLQPIQPLHSQ